MSTNYYLELQPPCTCCDRPFDNLHIGKSSIGWAFSLHVDPDNGINNLDDWVRLWSQPNAVIWDGYGHTLEPSAMLIAITERYHPRGLRHHGTPEHVRTNDKPTYDLIEGDLS